MNRTLTFKQLGLVLVLAGFCLPAQAKKKHHLVAVSPVERPQSADLFEMPDLNAPPVVLAKAATTTEAILALPPEPAVTAAPAELADSQTEAVAIAHGTCPFSDGRCNDSLKAAPKKIDIAKIEEVKHLPVPEAQPQVAKTQSHVGPYHSQAEQCYSQSLLAAAKKVVRKKYGNREHSVGKCARGVRDSLNASGIFNDYKSGLGNAVDYQARGKLKAIGFKEHTAEYKDVDPKKLPPGAVLVFAGPNTGDYLTTGSSGRLHRNKRGKWVRSGALGDWLGHVTIVGDDGKFYTDGRTEEPALGWPKNKKRRHLVGVWLMDHCTSSCSKAILNKCGG